MRTQESAENYLETIFELSQKTTEVRSIDIANEMGFSKPSISRAMSLFKEKGYIIVDNNGYITLTDNGLKIAKRVTERHMVLTEFLKFIGVSDVTAGDDACRIEHVISDETFDMIKKQLRK